jgi:hypothetical protein
VDVFLAIINLALLTCDGFNGPLLNSIVKVQISPNTTKPIIIINIYYEWIKCYYGMNVPYFPILASVMFCEMKTRKQSLPEKLRGPYYSFRKGKWPK